MPNTNPHVKVLRKLWDEIVALNPKADRKALLHMNEKEMRTMIKKLKKNAPAKKVVVKAAKTLTFKGAKTVTALLNDAMSVKAGELSQETMAYLALTLIKKGETIAWKELIARFNKLRKGMPQASVTSDPSAGKHDGWNLRNWWWNFEHKADTGCHAQGKGQLMLKAVGLNASLVSKLHRRFFKTIK